jgi:hypothetical protein
MRSERSPLSSRLSGFPASPSRSSRRTVSTSRAFETSPAFTAINTSTDLYGDTDKDCQKALHRYAAGVGGFGGVARGLHNASQSLDLGAIATLSKLLKPATHRYLTSDLAVRSNCPPS